MSNYHTVGIILNIGIKIQESVVLQPNSYLELRCFLRQFFSAQKIKSFDRCKQQDPFYFLFGICYFRDDALHSPNPKTNFIRRQNTREFFKFKIFCDQLFIYQFILLVTGTKKSMNLVINGTKKAINLVIICTCGHLQNISDF